MTQGKGRIFRQPTPRQSDDEARILPLINIVFLLLIFFMVAGRIAVDDLFPIHPPQSIGGKAPAASEITVLVRRDGQLALDGEPVTAESLPAALGARLGGSAGAALWLKADADVEALRVVQVLDELRRAGIANVQLLTQVQR